MRRAEFIFMKTVDLSRPLLMKKLNTIIIDDEWLIRTELVRLLNQHEKINIIGEAANFSEASQLIEDKSPDLVFLDIQLPGGSGFDLLDQMSGNFKTVFISAFDQYVDKAKHYNAEAILLKPISQDELKKVIDKMEM